MPDRGAAVEESVRVGKLPAVVAAVGATLVASGLPAVGEIVGAGNLLAVEAAVRASVGAVKFPAVGTVVGVNLEAVQPLTEPLLQP